MFVLLEIIDWNKITLVIVTNGSYFTHSLTASESDSPIILDYPEIILLSPCTYITKLYLLIIFLPILRKYTPTSKGHLDKTEF